MNPTTDEPRLLTARLCLHPISPKDSDDLYEAVVRHDSVMRWLATGRSGTPADALKMCCEHAAHWERHGYGDFAVRSRRSNQFVGRVGLRNRSGFGVDLGFAIDPGAEGLGFAREAGEACLEWAFGSLGLTTVFGYVLPDNKRSAALLSRLGARPAGTVVSSGNHCLRFQFDGRQSVPH